MKLGKRRVVVRGKTHYHQFPSLKSLLDLLPDCVGGGVLIERQAHDVVKEFFGQDSQGAFFGNVELGAPSALAEGLNDGWILRVEVEPSIAFSRESDADIISFLGDALETHRSIDIFAHEVLRKL